MRQIYPATLAPRRESAYFSRMKKIFPVLAIVLSAAGSGAAFAPENGFGVGIVLGSPSGLSGSLPMGETNAINAVIGYDAVGHANLHLQADYVWIRNEILPVESGRVSLYYGPGAFAVISGHAALGVRAVVGVDYWFQEAPVQLFLELGPGINVLPNTAPAASAGLGARYYF
jgi:hypothetical protein